MAFKTTSYKGDTETLRNSIWKDSIGIIGKVLVVFIILLIIKLLRIVATK